MKTNVMRRLDQAKIDYTAHQVQGADDPTHGVDVADDLGFPSGQVFKTLVAQSADKKQAYVFMIPVAEHLDLKKAAQVTGVKKIKMLPAKELLPLTGYVHGGCSPIGMKTQLPTYIDQSAADWEQIVFNGGQVGVQVELPLASLQAIVPVKLASLVVD